MPSTFAPELRRSSRAATKRVLPDYVGEKVKETTIKKARIAKAPKTTSSSAASSAKPQKVPAAPAATKKTKKPAAASPATNNGNVDENGSLQVDSASGALSEGDRLPTNLPEIQTHSGETTTLDALISASEKGIVIFAYPRAATSGCTTQACSFRDNYSSFKNNGYDVYGLSGDTPAANEKFSTKYTLGDIKLLSDPKYELHTQLGIKRAPKGTIRSVIVIGKKDDAAVILRKTPANPAQSVPIAQAAAGIASSDGATSTEKNS